MDESILDSIVVQYLETKGYERTAKQVRSNTRIVDYRGPLRLTDVKEWFDDHRDDASIFPPELFTAPTAAAGAGGADLMTASTTQTAPRRRERLDRNAEQQQEQGREESKDGEGRNRVFIGNLSFKIDEESLKEALKDCGEITEITWITDKETGRFYGTAFAVFDTVEAAEKAVTLANGRKILGREVKINIAPPKAGSVDIRRKMPPMPKLSSKPKGCKTIFMGNLSFEVTEEDVRAFFRGCGEIKQVRFQIRPDGSFKGCGFVEFEQEYSVEEAIQKHGRPLLGRPVRLDWE